MCDNTKCVFALYMLLNKINGKKYIGITSKTPEERWRNGAGYRGCRKINCAIKKYGWDNFYHIVLYRGLSKDQVYLLEKEYIRKHKTQDGNYGYNIYKGGEHIAIGQKMSDESKLKMSNSRKGMYVGDKNPMYGRHHTAEARKKISNANKGTKHPPRSQEYKDNISKRSKKKVLCIELGIEFESIAQAAQYCSISNSCIGKVCNHTIATAGGYHWEFVNSNDIYSKKSKKKRETSHNACRVYCITTNQVFPSLSDAGRKLNLDYKYISKVCKGIIDNVKGYKFIFLDKTKGGDISDR